MTAMVGPTGIHWADWLIAVALVLGALGVIWTKVLRPVVRGARFIEQVIPVLVDIAREFHENDGHTLKDSLNRIERQLAANSRQVSDQAVKLETLEKYAHKYRHEQGNDITKLLLADDLLRAKLDQLAAHLEPLPAQLDAIADAASAADTAAVEHREAHPENTGE